MENGIREFNQSLLTSLGPWSTEISEIQIPSGASLSYCLLSHTVFKEEVIVLEISIMFVGEKIAHNCF